MKVIRRSPVTRATAWLLTLAMIAPVLFLGRAARAQGDQQVIRVVVADIVNKTPGISPHLGENATAAVYTELANSGQGKFNVASTSEVRNEAISLGIKVPSNPAAPANFTDADLVRIAKSLNADAVLTGEVGATKPSKGKPVGVGLLVTLKDVAADIPINGGGAITPAAIRPGEPLDTEEQYNRAIADSAQDVVRQVVQRQVPTGTVLNINQGTAIINRGIRDGYKIGDRVIILREAANGSKIKEGEVRVARSYATDSEADIIQNLGGIQPEDLTRVYYTNTFTLPLITVPGGIHVVSPVSTQHGPNFSAAAIGGTVGVIALGVLLAQATRGGQQSVTDITAEASSQVTTPTVLVRWRDNIFGQANVLQYKIYRDPDFPFGVTVPSTGTGGTGGGTGTTSQTIPVDVVSGIFHSYTDLPSPHLPYATGNPVLIGGSNGGLGSSAGSGGGNTGNGGGGGGNTNSGGSFQPAATTDTGFTPGKSYNYLVSAIILRQVPSSGGTGNTGGGTGNTGGGTGNTGGGTGNGSGNGNTGGTEFIETDPAISGLVTPITPVLLITPPVAAANINAKAFSPTWNSRVGADLFQLEISTDRNFKTPSLIYTQQVFSTAPLTDGLPQGVPATIDLTVIPQLLASPAFAAFVAQSNGTTPSPPQIFWRVGARFDGDNPGPVHWISGRADDPDRTFRFVYDTPSYFYPAPLPPPPPGKGSAAATALTKRYAGRAGFVVPTAGIAGTTRSQSRPRVLSPQEILSGGARTRN